MVELGRPRRQDGEVSEYHGTLEENMSEVRNLFEEERSLGWMVEMSDKEVQEACGWKLYIASLAVVTEKDKIRLVHDATNKVQVNNRIRARDQARSPAREMRTLQREWQERRGGAKMFAVIGDASKAHRGIKVKEEDWGYQACRLQPGRVWLNTVGTGFSWMLLGTTGLGSGDQEMILVFADDAAMFAASAKEIGATILLWVALGVPWKWSKIRGGQEVDWIGNGLSVANFRLGISEKRARWIRDWVSKTLEKGFAEMRNFGVLGRLCFAVGALDYLRPIAAPLFAWAAAVGTKATARLPWSVSFLLRFVADNVHEEGKGLCGEAARGTPGTCFYGGRKCRRSACMCWRLELSWGMPPGASTVVLVGADAGLSGPRER